jgi:hypothetical protein
LIRVAATLKMTRQSTKRRSLLSLVGKLLAEISLPKLIPSWTMLFIVPGLARTDTAGCFGLGKDGFAQNHILSAGILACIATRNGDRRWIVRNAGAVSHSRKQFLVVEFACHRTDLRGLPRGIAAPREKDFAIAD